MNPNKKVLNSKNNSPWLLCPSKSFPGKFYYFNGLTGEAAWSSNDADGKIPKKGIQTITDKKHPYPEPFGPPADESTNTSSSSIRKSSFVNRTDFSNKPNQINTNYQNRSNFDDLPSFCNRTNFSGPNKSNNAFSFGNSFSNRPNLGNGTNISSERNFSTIISRESHSNYVAPTPMFGQAVFPRYISNEGIAPKMIWALTPMLVPEHKQMLDQITQYEPQDNIFIQSSVQLTNGFQEPNRSLANLYQYDKFNTSTPVQKQHAQTQMFGQALPQKFNVFSTGTQIFDPKRQTKEEACQTIEPKVKKAHTQTERKLAPNLIKPSRFVENLSTKIDTEKSPLCSRNKDDNVLDVSENTVNKLSVLDKNDLRFLLVAKKNKHMDDTSKSASKLENSAPKKRVTFNLVDEDNSSTEDVHEDNQSIDNSECDVQKSTTKVQPQRIWYLATDLAILLTEFDYIEQFVLSDENCRLLIPYKVYSYVEAQSRGEGCGRHSIFVARQILRKLATSPPHIIVQHKPDSTALNDEDPIIDCCWQLLQDECHVVLITNDAKLTNKAQILGIECHTINKVKGSEIPKAPKAVEPFDLKKPLTITVNNKKPTENLFQQNLKEINPFGLSETEDFPARSARANLFNNRSIEEANIFKKVGMSTNTNETVKNFKNTLQSRDEIDDLDNNISRLDITDNAVENLWNKNGMAQNQVNKYRNYVNERNDKECAVSGIVKLNRVFDLDAELKNYCIKSDVMEFRANIRREEWICRLLQIMEEVLTFILLKDNCKYKIMPPWSLYEAAQLIGNKFKNLPNIKPIVERLSQHLFNISSNRGFLNKNMKPTELIKLIGYCMILVENLKETLDFVELTEAKTQISELIENMENPETDIDLTLDNVNTPVRNEMELVNNQPVVYRKHKSEILEYLKIHYPAMESYELENSKTRVVRTNGKDLNTVKIDSAKNISVENTDALPEKVEVFEPKVIRNVNIIEAFEEKLKKNAKVDLDQLDIEETLSMTSDENYNDYCDFQEEIEYAKNEKEKSDVDLAANVADETLSCDLNNECVHTYSLVKSFLAELQRTFVLIYNFISETMQEYQEGLISENKKSDIDVKTNMAYKYTLKIIDRLKSITIREESHGPNLRDLLLRAGDYSEYDETITSYKQVISKYLEQAEILEEALKIMLTLTRYNLEQDSISTNGGAYCGTFAATTVIRDQSDIINNNMAVQLTN